MNPRHDRLPQGSSPASLRIALAGIDAELAAVRLRVEELGATRQSIVDTLKSIVYPILTIPVEITAEIFLQCIDRAAEISGTPLALASVCKQWRAVALNLQPMWSRLQISNVPFHKARKLQALLAWWVPRAGGRLLDVDMTDSDGRLLTALIPHSLRLKTLTCDFSLLRLYPAGLANLKGRIPHLEKLRILPPMGRVPTEMRSIFSIFSDAPLLREAHITGLAFDPFTLPWGQLTTLGLGGYSRESYAEILRHTPQIQILRLECGGGGDLPQPLPPAVAALTLHHLHTLELHGDREGQEEEEALVYALTLPSLRNLDLAAVPMELEDAVVELLTRSDCSLASVSIRSPSRYLYRQLAFGKAARTLDEIHITDLDWNPHELDEFFLDMYRISMTRILPKLRTLSMSSSRLVDIPYAAIAEMVASRQGSGRAPLESFHFTHPQVMPFRDDSEAFAMFRDATLQGCRVDVPGLNFGFERRFARYS